MVNYVSYALLYHRMYLPVLLVIITTFKCLVTKSKSDGSDWLYDNKGKCRRELQMFCNPGHKSTEAGSMHHLTKQYEYVTDEIIYDLYISDGKTKQFTHAELNGDNFDPPYIDDTIPTKILVHGARSERTLNEKLKETYLELTTELNIITVDWEVFEQKILSPLLPNSAFLLAGCLKQLIEKLFQSGNVNNVHIIGHSISAHAAGIAGRQLKKNGLLLRRITGLDAANPYMDSGLSKEDAYFVDVIHTNAELLPKFQIIGHADFYPNGGRGNQPDCWQSDLPHSLCNTLIAYIFYEATISNPYRFLTFKCKNKSELANGDCSGGQAYMGEHVNVASRGIYYLKFDEIVGESDLIL